MDKPNSHLSGTDVEEEENFVIKLPEPKTKGGKSLEECLLKRRSQRRFAPDDELSLETLSQLCWAAQGSVISESRGKKKTYRTAPSAGAVFPIELFLVMKNATYMYESDSHSLHLHLKSDLRADISAAALHQKAFESAALTIVLCADIQSSRDVFGNISNVLVTFEGGHIGQNILLQCTALDLACVPSAAIVAETASKAMQLPRRLRPIYVIGIGHPIEG